MGSLEDLWIVGKEAASKENSAAMSTRRYSPCSNRAVVCLAWAATHCFYPSSRVLSVTHAVVVDQNGLGGWNIHDTHFIMSAPCMLAGDFWDKQNVYWFPGTKSSCIIVCGGVLLSKDVANNIPWHLRGRTM